MIYNQTCTIQSITLTQDGDTASSGSITSSCMLETLRGQEKFMLGGQYADITHIIYLPVSVTIIPANIIIIGSGVFEVHVIDKVQGMGTHQEILCRQVV